ncbi:MAG: Gfo/Idh/MocA family oxidoreductase [Acidimicrobiia bacterium]|nr:Gfo/Idh/MocA family oxidoreductase [Acidimicrobiia bacterium]
MTDRLNITLLGSKFMGRAHSNAWSQVGRFFDVHPRPVLHTVVARNAAELADFAKQWDWANYTTDWNAAVTADETDLVDIATPNRAHREAAIVALEAGKHVACEKPLAATLEDAEAMAAAAAAAPGRTFVWFNYRRVPAVALAHRIVASGALGRIYHARASYLQSWGGPNTPLLWRFQGDIAGSGAHGDLNAHIVDAVRFITGEEITSVEGAIEETFIEERELLDGSAGDDISRNGAIGRSTVDDAVLFLSRLSGGGIASFEATRLATGYSNANRIEIHGESGALRFNFERMNELGYFRDDLEGSERGWTTIDVTRGADGHPYAGAWWPPGHGLGYEHGFVNQARDIVAVIGRGEPEVPLPDFADALQTQRVLQAAIDSAREHQPIQIEQP